MEEKYTISRKGILYQDGMFRGFVLHTKEAENNKIIIEYFVNVGDEIKSVTIDKSQLNNWYFKENYN